MSRRSNIARRESSITIPERVSPHVRLVFCEMKRQAVTYDDLEFGAGVLRTTVKAWRHKNKPNLESIEAVLGYLGFDFVPIPRESVLPSDLRDQLKDASEKFELNMGQSIRCLVEIVANIHSRFGEQVICENDIQTLQKKKRTIRASIHPDQIMLMIE